MCPLRGGQADRVIGVRQQSVNLRHAPLHRWRIIFQQ